MANRRKFLAAGTLLAGGAYLYHRGVRFPRMGLTPAKLDHQVSKAGVRYTLDGVISLPTDAVGGAFRAYKPDFKIRLEGLSTPQSISINNVSPAAELRITAESSVQIDESQAGITRKLTISNPASDTIDLEWRIPGANEVTFAVIGDTGGNAELEWCLKRAKELNADFLLHLGDFNYGNGDYDRAINYFHDSPIPCYISIGNHDFNDSGLVYEKFRTMLGPLNTAFEIAGTRFINFDTGADFLPVHKGLRGDFFRSMTPHLESNHIYYTHRPLMDPRPGEDHIVGSQGEIDWIIQMINKLGRGPLLTGHVHHSAELNIHGIKQYTVGEGLGHEDILLKRKVAKMLLGKAVTGEALKLSWEPIDMPWNLHLSHTHESKLKKRGDAEHLQWYHKQVSVET